MSIASEPRRSLIAEGLYGVLNPIPFGCFVAALVFDIVYSKSAEILWDKGAAWLILFGLLFALVPRLLNLTRIWISFRRTSTRADKMDFWVNLVAIIVAILNSFVHSRDAYAVVPEGLWLSACTVLLLSMGFIAIAVERGHREMRS